MKTADRVIGWLLVASTAMHCVGCLFAFLHTNADLLLWTEGVGIGGFLLAAANLLRVNRPDDRGLAWVSAAGCVAWAMIAVAFGVGIGTFSIRARWDTRSARWRCSGSACGQRWGRLMFSLSGNHDTKASGNESPCLPQAGFPSETVQAVPALLIKNRPMWRTVCQPTPANEALQQCGPHANTSPDFLRLPDDGMYAT